MFLLLSRYRCPGGGNRFWLGRFTDAWCLSQFCTNPGIAVVVDGPEADKFTRAAKSALEKVAPQTMLTKGIATAYHEGVDRMRASNAVAPVLTAENA